MAMGGPRQGQVTFAVTRAERDVLAQMLMGKSNREIAGTLGCSIKNVEFHVSKILRKAGAPSRARLLALVMGSSSDDGGDAADASWEGFRPR
jgi:DNA-binding CsgD family transcriptional regulator